MADDLNGKVAIVTGGARDIGRAISIKFGALGASVVVNYNDSSEEVRKIFLTPVLLAAKAKPMRWLRLWHFWLVTPRLTSRAKLYK